jgi:hypothetical protein
MIAGDLGLIMWKNMNAVYFNKQIADQHELVDTLYEKAENGDWTMEFLMQCAELSSAENGNQVWDTEDTYGLYLYPFVTRAMVTYFDIPLTELNESGEYEICLYNERTESIYGKLHQWFWENDYVFMQNSDGDVYTGRDMFMEDRLMFLPGALSVSQDLREMEGSWGILPAPKFNDEQEAYHSHSYDTFSVFIIPGHTDDPEFCGTVVDALSAESKFSVIPAYYDVVLKGRTTKDEQSGRMIDIARDHMKFDFVFGHITAMDFMWTQFGNTVASASTTSYKPTYDTKADTYEAKLGEIMDAYWDVR